MLLLFGRLLLSHVIIPQLMTDNRVGAVNEESNITNKGNSDGDKVITDFVVVYNQILEIIYFAAIISS